MTRGLRLAACALAAAGAAAFAGSAGCRGSATGSGYLGIHDARYFEYGESSFRSAPSPGGINRVEFEISPCDPDRRSVSAGDFDPWNPPSERDRRLEEERDRNYRDLCSRSFNYVMDLPAFYSVSGLIVDARCGRMTGVPDHVVCTGHSLEEGNHGLGPVDFVVALHGNEIVGFHIWRHEPAPPELVASFGDVAVDWRPDRIRFSAPSPSHP